MVVSNRKKQKGLFLSLAWADCSEFTEGINLLSFLWRRTSRIFRKPRYFPYTTIMWLCGRVSGMGYQCSDDTRAFAPYCVSSKQVEFFQRHKEQPSKSLLSCLFSFERLAWRFIGVPTADSLCLGFLAEKRGIFQACQYVLGFRETSHMRDSYSFSHFTNSCSLCMHTGAASPCGV